MKLELPYVAGLFDGEGWIRVNKARFKDYHIQYQLVVGISLTNWPVIRALQENFPNNVYRKHHDHTKNPNNKVSFNWRCNSQRAADFLSLIRPWLIAKREECDLAIQFQMHVATNKNVLRYQSERRPEINAIREDFMNRIRLLKKRNWNALNGSDPIPDQHSSCQQG